MILLSGCVPATTVQKTDLSLPAKGQNCDIQFFIDSKPTGQYSILGEIESHIKNNFFFEGSVQLEDEGFDELRKQACDLGGDAVIIDDYIQSSAAEMTHIHVWASVAKLKE